MARRLRKSDAQAQPSLRASLRDHYAERLTRHSGIPNFFDGHAAHVREALDAGEPVVLAAWELARYRVPVVRRGAHAFYRVEPNGCVVEVVPQRDPDERLSIVAWDCAQAA